MLLFVNKEIMKKIKLWPFIYHSISFSVLKFVMHYLVLDQYNTNHKMVNLQILYLELFLISISRKVWRKRRKKKSHSQPPPRHPTQSSDRGCKTNLFFPSMMSWIPQDLIFFPGFFPNKWQVAQAHTRNQNVKTHTKLARWPLKGGKKFVRKSL